MIRRILRRAVRYYYSYLDYKQPLLIPIDTCAWQNNLKMFFLNCIKQVDFVSKVVKEEEEAFLKTLEAGIKLFNSSVLETFNNNLKEIIPGSTSAEVIERLRESVNRSLAPLQDVIKEEAKRLEEEMKISHGSLKKAMGEVTGQLAFKLYDTYGFPLDLTRLLAKEIDIDVDDSWF